MLGGTDVMRVTGAAAALLGLHHRKAPIPHRLGCSPVARIGIALEQYEDEPDAILDETHRATGACDLKPDFRDRAALARFLREYETLAPAGVSAKHRR